MSFYKVDVSFGDCLCDACAIWTVTFPDAGETAEIGTSWVGEEGRDKAEDTCDLMNMAYEQGYSSGFKGA